MMTVNRHTTSASLEQHVRNIITMLSGSHAHFLIGGAFLPIGIKPVTFTRNVSDEFMETLTKATPGIVADLLIPTQNRNGGIQ